jgi:hypothetical protein
MHGTIKTPDEVEKGHVKPPSNRDVCHLGKISRDGIRIIRTLQAKTRSSRQCSQFMDRLEPIGFCQTDEVAGFGFEHFGTRVQR